MVHILSLPVLCWILLFSLWSDAEATDSNAPATTTTATTSATRFSFSHLFTAESSFLATLTSQQDGIHQSQSDLIVITSPMPFSTANATVTIPSKEDNATLDTLLKTYSLVSENRVAFKMNQWHTVRDSALNGSVWTRLRANDATKADVCVVILPASSMDSPLLIQIAARANTFCAPQDIMLLGFTASLSTELAQYLKGENAINGQYVPRIMKEVLVVAQQHIKTTQLDSTTAINRLFVSVPGASCVESASAMSDPATKTTAMTVQLCVGTGCSTCAMDPDDQKLPDAGDAGATTATTTHESSDKRGLVVLLSCGSFLIGCGCVFYVLFKKQFFMPSESTKPEKELTTNLAYVLRM